MEGKQNYMREEIVQQGYDPAKFYQYWETLNLNFQQVQLEQLKIIVQTYKQTLLKKNQEDEDFDQFQDPNQQSYSEYKKHQFNYQDFNWEFLIPKSSPQKQKQKVQQKPSKITIQKPGLVKQIKSIAVTKQMVKTKLKQVKEVNLIDDLDQSVLQTDKKLKNKQVLEPQGILQKSVNITFKQVQDQSKITKVKCLKLQQNILNHHKNVQIIINNIDEIQEKANTSYLNKFWKGTQYQYTIKTIGRNKNRSVGVSWQVKRKYSDFQWLKTTLIKMYPGVVVPPLPPLPKNKDKILGHKKKLQNFLMDTYRCVQLRNSKHFQIFLSYGNFTDFQGFKKTTESMAKPVNLNHILNMKGQVEVLFGVNIQLFAAGVQQYFMKSSQHLKNVKQMLTQITDYYDNISACYTQLSGEFDLMSKESCQFSSQKCFPKLTQTYKQISSLIGKHSQFCQEEKNNIDTFMISHFSYEKDRIDNMQTLFSKKSQFTTELGKRDPKSQGSGVFGKITGGVASLFGQKTESVQIPSSKYETLYNQTGFYNSQLLKQTVRCIQVMIQSQIVHFSGYGISRIDSVDKLQKTWSTIMVQLSKLNIN